MQVSPQEPFRLVCSLLNHEYWGYLFETFVVQLDQQESLTLLNQRLTKSNISEFDSDLNSSDIELINLCDALQPEVIWKKFSPKKFTPNEFFLKVYDPQKGDKTLQEIISNYVNKIKAELLPLLLNKRLFVMGNDGNPIWQEIEVLPQKATVLFHFRRNEESTHYFPTIKYAGQKVEFQYKNAYILCDEPAWLVCERKLYHFEKEVDGKKLRPFLNKKFILIPKKIEEDYYRKFVTSIITYFDVYATGFEIRSEAFGCVPLLNINETKISAKAHQATLFGGGEQDEEDDVETHIEFNLSFQYGQYTFRFDSFSAASNVSMERQGDEYVFHKVKREIRHEKEVVLQLRDWGLDLRTGRASMPRTEGLAWLQQYHEGLKAQGFVLHQKHPQGKQYFLGVSTIQVAIVEGNDWFDIQATVCFGAFEVPFLKLKDLIMRGKREYILPNGEVALIPDVWFTQYSDLFAFAEVSDDKLVLKKYHVTLVQELAEERLVEVVMSRKLANLQDFKAIETTPLPSGFTGNLRPYQQAGYDWLHFLKKYQFGGCLADDMGLGKTIQTLALLQAQKEAGSRRPSLLVMPTSLIYNWELEARRFTPNLRVLVYTGTYRDKDFEKYFEYYDLILTSYGIVRIDIDLLKRYRFDYVILDESQAIKNPSSNITKAVTELNSQYRLVLTGTPVENNTMDLWSQMSFINPGLLGNQQFFRNEYQIPIEKKNDEKKTQRLYALIKPFFLRRHKRQVAKDLPPKVESVLYCEMSEEQAYEYEETKSFYRNLILKHIETEGVAKSQMLVLQGLTRLRQLANHPHLAKEDYTGDSGKFDDVWQRMETAIAEGHKILVFSQFVKHLELFKQRLDNQNISYTYLDGSTTNRQTQVEAFQNDEGVRIFLISLKAGGVGLNLTAADYVFILDPWWNPAIEAQATDRAHRIGQDKTVFTYKFIAKDTVEEKILTLQGRKLQLANDLITTEEGFLKSLSKEDILSLLE